MFAADAAGSLAESPNDETERAMFEASDARKTCEFCDVVL